MLNTQTSESQKVGFNKNKTFTIILQQIQYGKMIIVGAKA